MYTPRPSSRPPDPDPSSTIRVLIRPSQSAYFAGEPFSCTITFTNTRTASPAPASVSASARSVSSSPFSPSPVPLSPGTFSPGHKRAAHSVTSAPLARPPTSPGTPKTAYPTFPSFLTGVTGRENGKKEAEITRRGLIGKGPSAAAAAGATERKRKQQHASKSLSVDVSPQDLLRRLGEEEDSPASPFPSSSSSPIVSSPLGRDPNLPSSHPHARKQSIIVDVPSTLSPNSPPTPTTPTPSLSLPSINESFPPQAPPPRRPSSLRVPPASSRVKSLSSPPVTAFTSSFPHHAPRPPSTELLLYGYAQLTGTFVLDPISVSTSAELVKLRETLKRRGAIGGGSLDLDIGAAGVRGPRGKGGGGGGGGGFWGFWGGGSSSSGGGHGSSPSPGAAGEEYDDALPTLETQPSMLAIDLELAPGESKTYAYTLDLPDNLPPTFRGRMFRFSYQLVVGTCRASTPFAAASSDRRRSRIMHVPIRVYHHVAVGQPPRPYNLLWPIARRREKAVEGKTEEVKATKGSIKPAQRMGSLEKVQAYARQLLAGEVELDAEEADRPGEGGGLSGCREAVEITTRNPKKISYDVTKSGEKVAELTFVKSAYRLGETVLGVVEMNDEHARSRVLKLSAMLEGHERLPWTEEVVRRVHAEHHSSLVVDMRRVSFGLDIPSDGSPEFDICGEDGKVSGGLEWKLRLCLLVSVGTGAGNAKGKGRAVEVRAMMRDGSPGEWGRGWRAPEELLPMERSRTEGAGAMTATTTLTTTTTTTTNTPSRLRTWTAAMLNPFAAGLYHDADETNSDSEDEGEWTEMGIETVECVVPVRVYPGNTAFRALEVVFEV